MGKHLNPLEKEQLIKQFQNSREKMTEFCARKQITVGTFKKWMKQYKENGVEGLSRAAAKQKTMLPDGVEPTEEMYKREILKLRIENERLKKNYTVQETEAGEREYIRLKPKNSK